MNGDGYADLAVGAPLYDNGQTDEGRAFMYQGLLGGSGTTAIWTAEGDQAGAQFGGAIAAAGDVDGNGFGDFLAGSSYYDSPEVDEGRAFLYSGSAAGMGANGNPPNADWMAAGNQNFERFGSSVGAAGDNNGDGYADILVGAPFYDNGQADEGAAFLYRGSATGIAGSAAWTTEAVRASQFVNCRAALAVAWKTGDGHGAGGLRPGGALPMDAPGVC